ncbi:MAG: hypothetical protein WAM28_04585 [Chlamydiales bacterium]
MLPNLSIPDGSGISPAYPIQGVKPQQKGGLTTLEKVKITAYAIFLAFKTLLSAPCRILVRMFVFRSGLLVSTINRGKISEIKQYLYGDSPCVKPLKGLAEKLGLFETQAEKLKIEGKGKCYGGVIHFLKETENQDPEKVAQDFKGGMPIQAAKYQEIYRRFKHGEIKGMTQAIIDIIDSNPQTPEDYDNLQDKWTWDLKYFKPLRLYLESGKRPNPIEDFADDIRQLIKDGGCDREFKDKKYYFSFIDNLRQVAQHYGYYGGENIGRINCDNLGLHAAGLMIESVIHSEKNPEALLASLKCPQPGKYVIITPTYNILGKERNPHALGLIVGENGDCYFLDPNFAIGKYHVDQLTEVVGRIFSLYVGRRTLIREQLAHALSPSKHPSSPSFNSGFSLYKVKTAPRD